METGLTLLRTFGLLAITLFVGATLFASNVGRAAANSAARAAAASIADTLEPDFACVFTPAESDRAKRAASQAVVEYLEGLPAISPVETTVDLDEACAVVVGVEVSALARTRARGVACYYPLIAATAAVEPLARC